MTMDLRKKYYVTFDCYYRLFDCLLVLPVVQ